MEQYRIQGIHCKDCAEKLEEKLNQSQTEPVISIDYSSQRMTIQTSEVNRYAIDKILEFEKVTKRQVEKETEERAEHHHNHHSHHHGVSQPGNGDATRNITIVFILNIVFSLLEFIFGFLFNSMAILTDAVHDLGDAISIGMAGYFQRLSTKEANERYGFGHQRFSLLGAVFTALVLIVGSVLVLYHSIPRLFNAEAVNYQGMFWLSIVAIIANGYSAWLLSRGSSHNESVLNLHMMEDLLGWIGVLVVSIILHFTDWYVLDPLLSIAIALFILYKTWTIFKETVEIFLEATPKHLSKSDIEESILKLDDVSNISHLHIWSIDGVEHAMTVTISTTESSIDRHNHIKEQIHELVSHHNITHKTIEIVYDPDDILAVSLKKRND